VLYLEEKFNLDWVIRYFKENEDFLALVMRELGIIFDRAEFIFTIDELKEGLEKCV